MNSIESRKQISLAETERRPVKYNIEKLRHRLLNLELSYYGHRSCKATIFPK